MSASKQKGTRAESAVRDYLKQWFPNALRPAQRGVKDEGDIVNVPDCTIEVKNRGTYAIPAWLRETIVEQGHADTPWSVLVVKPNGVGETRVGEWWAIEPLEQWARKHAELAQYENAIEA